LPGTPHEEMEIEHGRFTPIDWEAEGLQRDAQAPEWE
jgi:hypothetical protein